MSTLVSQARARAPRFAESAVERARLSLVPVRRTRPPRAPFAVLVFAILGAGVVGLLMFNTHMQQASFYATRLQQQADDLTARQQALDMDLERLRAPQRLAEAGKALGMVAPGVPAFVRLSDGTVIGTPTPASPDDSVRIDPLPPGLPRELQRKPIIVRVPAPGTTAPDTAQDLGQDPATTIQPVTPGTTEPTTRKKQQSGAGR
jgi:hypothetical protein